MEPVSGYRHIGWKEYNVSPAKTYEDIEQIWEEVKNGDKDEYAYIADVIYGSKAKFIAVTSSTDTSSVRFAGQMKDLFERYTTHKHMKYLHKHP